MNDDEDFKDEEKQEAAVAITVTYDKIFITDLILFNSQDYTDENLATRKTVLFEKIITEEIHNEFQLVRYEDNCNSQEKIKEYIGQQLIDSSMPIKGFVFKGTDEPYPIGYRNPAWFFLKTGGKNGNIKLQENSIDLLLMGAMKKNDVSYSGFLLGAFDNSKKIFVGVNFLKLSLPKINYKNLIVSDQPENYDIPSNIINDKSIVWFKPELVCELQYSDMYADTKKTLAFKNCKISQIKNVIDGNMDNVANLDLINKEIR
jgi:ATP-dependent DNA ligase